ncbi:MAG: hypothetical protein AAF192_01890 [Pseudomonadota bacterium]
MSEGERNSETPAGDAPETAPGDSAEVFEFHPHRGKLWILCGALGLMALWLLSSVFSPPEGGVDPVALGFGVSILTLASAMAGRAASDPRPVLRADAEGLVDRVHGRVPWEDLQSWTLRRSSISPGFGWSMKPGRVPPENVGLFRFQRVMNSLTGLPHRNYRRKLLADGVEPIAEALRTLRPELEA